MLAVAEQADGREAAIGASARSTKTGKSHSTCRARASCWIRPDPATEREPASFDDEHFRRRGLRPALRATGGRAGADMRADLDGNAN